MIDQDLPMILLVLVIFYIQLTNNNIKEQKLLNIYKQNQLFNN